MTSLADAGEQPQILQKLKGVRLPRVSGLQSKLIIPYVVLTLLIAAVGTYVVTRLVVSSIRERFVNHLYEASRVAADNIVRREQVHLEDLRLMANYQGVAQAILDHDAETLFQLLEPLALNSNVDIVTMVDLNGIEIVTLGRNPGTGQYLLTEGGVDFSSRDLVKNILTGYIDEIGDKYVGLLETRYGVALSTSAPVRQSNQLAGVLIIGTYLDSLLGETKEQSLADIVILNDDRELIATTLVRIGAEADEHADEVAFALEEASQNVTEQNYLESYELQLYGGRPYQVLYAPFIVRQQRFGWLGVVLPSNYVVSTEATSRNTFAWVFSLGTLGTIVIGYALSQSIARPILRLRSLSQSVASGDLDQSSGLRRSDEIGELAEAFDQMTLQLQERTAEAARLYAETVQRNKELAAINAKLQAAQLQLIQSEKLAAIGQLTAGIVHDVKNPLAVIKGMAELMQQDDLPAQLQEEIGVIRESAVKANRIVSDLLKFARQTKPEITYQDMRETIEAALRLTAYLTRAAHVQVVKDLPSEPVIASYDSQQIEQVLINMIDNATHAMPDGGTLRVNLSAVEGVVAIAIQDTGTGIAPEHLSRIFDPFFTTKPEGMGTGLGLSVSYGIISTHRGRIDVESELGKGTTFTILLPTDQQIHPEESVDQQVLLEEEA